MITFPTRGVAPGDGRRGYVPLGLPLEADACQCDHGPMVLFDEDSCTRCGRFLEPVIRATWERRARELDRDQWRPLVQAA